MTITKHSNFCDWKIIVLTSKLTNYLLSARTFLLSKISKILTLFLTLTQISAHSKNLENTITMKRLITKPLLISTLNCLMKPLLLTLFVQLWLDLLYFCLASWNVTLFAKAWNPKLMLNPMRTKMSSFIGDSHFMSDAPYAGRGRT